MIRLKDVIPASYEVTFLPLVLAYVWFGLGLSLSVYVALLGPILYGLVCVLFIAGDLGRGTPMTTLLAKIAFVLVCLSPAALVCFLSET